MPSEPRPPKYAAREIERRWLVEQGADQLARDATEVRRIEDRYIAGTHLRLRKVEQEGRAPIFKLGKKYVADGARCGHVVSVYLAAEEYDVLMALPGQSCTKTRFSIADGALDVYAKPRLPFAVFEREFGTEQAAHEYVPPAFASREVTGDAEFSGYMLARR